MKTSTLLSTFLPALVAAQAKFGPVVKNQTNETFGNQFADLSAVIDATKRPLLEQGILVIQSPTASTEIGVVCLTTRLQHVSGEFIEDTCTSPLPRLDPQGYAAAVTYLRRKTLMAMLGLAEDDDDGNATTTVSGASVIGAQASTDQKQKQWLDLVKTANLERLTVALGQVGSVFKDSPEAIATLTKAIEERKKALGVDVQA
jgi:hypothetical protein